jgi:hypothetical protein
MKYHLERLLMGLALLAAVLFTVTFLVGLSLLPAFLYDKGYSAWVFLLWVIPAFICAYLIGDSVE